MASGRVYLVGAGPGDPGLLTIRGKGCLELADVVIYDYLANPELLVYAPEGAEKICVGKPHSAQHLSQDQTNALLAEKTAAGKKVVRLKGGDPYIFGRGGEEAAFLSQQQIPFEVVPGISAGFAAAAYAGIPLTHRDVTTSLALLTGHERPERQLSSLDWETLAAGAGTLVFYMGITNLELISERLIEYGRSPQTPVAVIQWATLPQQKTLVGTLESIAADVQRQGIEPPAVIVIGEVVTYREQLRWFDKRPLFGKRILITRPQTQAASFARQLEQLGAQAICVPTIEIVPPDNLQPLDQAVRQLANFDSLILTSVNGVASFFERLAANNLDVRSLAGVEIIAVGPKTAEAIEAYRLRPDLIPERYQAEGLVDELLTRDLKGQRFLYPRAKVVRPLLIDSLRAAGAEVVAPVAYQTVAALSQKEQLRQLLLAGDLDAICFSSSSTFENLYQMFAEELAQLQGETEFFSIGQITSNTIRKHGFVVALEPEKSTLDELVAAMVEYYAE